MSLRGTGQRVNPPTFDFPVQAVCQLCGEITMKRETDTTDWGSVRYYAIQHQHKVHAYPDRFSGTVSRAFLNAKHAFGQDAWEVEVPADNTSAGFLLQRLAA